MKPLYAALALIALALLVFHLESRNSPADTALQTQPVFKMGYPCETWVRQSGGDAKPVFSCVKASRE